MALPCYSTGAFRQPTQVLKNSGEKRRCDLILKKDGAAGGIVNAFTHN